MIPGLALILKTIYFERLIVNMETEEEKKALRGIYLHLKEQYLIPLPIKTMIFRVLVREIII